MSVKRKLFKISDFGMSNVYGSIDNDLKINQDNFYFAFYKKGTNIIHNEYGSAIYYKNSFYEHMINNTHHRLSGQSIYSHIDNYKGFQHYYVIGAFVGGNIKVLIKKLADILIPKNNFLL